MNIYRCTIPDSFYCDNCKWTGDEDQLVDNTDDGNFDQCPRCGSMDIFAEEI